MLNNLNFVTLRYVDMTTVQIMSNLKIVATGVASYCLLGRRLNVGKWLALYPNALSLANSVSPAGVSLPEPSAAAT